MSPCGVCMLGDAIVFGVGFARCLWVASCPECVVSGVRLCLGLMTPVVVREVVLYVV